MLGFVDVKRILPLLLLIACIVVVGVFMLSTVVSQDRKEQKAWDEVLLEDREMAEAARGVSALVDRLEETVRVQPGDSPEVERLEEQIVSVWPNFARPDPSGGVSLPSFEIMRRQLDFYINRG